MPANERLVFVDLETAGLYRSAAIIQIAAVAVGSVGLKELESFEVKVRFDMNRASAKALDVNSFEPIIWKRLARIPHDAAYRFAEFRRRHATVDMISKKGPYRLAQLVAHSASFYSPLLFDWYNSLNIFLPASRRVFCTLQRSCFFFVEHQEFAPPADYKLGSLCQYFDVHLDENQAHDALNDVRATVALYRAIMQNSACIPANAPKVAV